MNTDSALKSDVLDELRWWPNVNAAHIGVAASAGVDTLSGHVEHCSEKAAAEKASTSVYGVKAIVNEIKVEIPTSGRRTDQNIAAAAVNAMTWDFQVPRDKVKIIVDNGVLTLEGDVEWHYQKDAAERCARYLMGVVAVNNMIIVKPATKWTDTKSEIEDAIRRKVDREIQQIKVETHDGAVTLSGHVDSWAERDQAVWAAWSAPGVRSVTNNLTVSPGRCEVLCAT